MSPVLFHPQMLRNDSSPYVWLHSASFFFIKTCCSIKFGSDQQDQHQPHTYKRARLFIMKAKKNNNFSTGQYINTSAQIHTETHDTSQRRKQFQKTTKNRPSCTQILFFSLSLKRFIFIAHLNLQLTCKNSDSVFLLLLLLLSSILSTLCLYSSAARPSASFGRSGCAKRTKFRLPHIKQVVHERPLPTLFIIHTHRE